MPRELSGGVHNSDCVTGLGDVDTASVDVVVTDPPYGINTKSDGMGKLDPWADMVNAAIFYERWMREVRRVLKPTGVFWSFLNWRSLVTFQKAACSLGWPIESLLVWDKQAIGPGGPRGLRPSYELVALWCGEDAAISDRGIADVRGCKWSGAKRTGHPAEKPVDLCVWLLELSGAGVGKLVVDPFVGSGTTGVAARRLGAEFTGFELDRRWCEVAESRIRSESSGLFVKASS